MVTKSVGIAAAAAGGMVLLTYLVADWQFWFLFGIRCELLVARGKETEKLASGLLKPFLSHLKAAEEQILKGADCIKLQPPPGYAGDQGGASLQKAAWFTKGTIERSGNKQHP